MKTLPIVATLFLLVNSLSAHPAQTTTSQEKVEAQGVLKLGEPQQRTLAPDVIHVWSLALEKGQYAVVEVLQMGIDVVVRIVDPTGARRGEFDSPTGTSGTENASWIANRAGTWKVEILPLEATQPGDYEIKLVALREATDRDRQIMQADSLYSLAASYQNQRKHAEAEALFLRSLTLRENALGPAHLDLAGSLDNLAVNYAIQGKYNEAVPFFLRSLQIRENALGGGHIDVAMSLNNLGKTYFYMGKYAEAEPFYKRALAIGEKALGPDHSDLAEYLNNMAALYRTQGKYAEAELFIKRSLTIWEKILGPDHSHVATSIGNLAGLYAEQGKYAEAEPLYKRNLIIKEKAFGPEHPEVALSLNNFAVFYMEQWRFSEAEPLLKRALAIREKTLRPEHPNVAESLGNLAALYFEQGKDREAEPLYKRAIAIEERALGPNHPNLAIALSNLAELYRKQYKFAEAERLNKQALAIKEKAFGPEHPDVALSLHNLSVLYRYQSKYDEGEPLVKRALEIQQKVLGLEHPNIPPTLINLAFFYGKRGKYAEAESLMLRSKEIREKNQLSGIGSLVNLALLYTHQGKYVEAAELELKILANDEKRLGSNHPGLANTLANLARVMFLADAQKIDTALALVNRAIAFYDATATSEPGWRLNAYAFRAQLRKQKGDVEGAFADLAEALRSAEKLRPQVGGGDETLAAFFGEYLNHFNRMVAWQLEAGQIEQALAYAEKGRSRILLDQLATLQVDVRQSIPVELRAYLELRETDAKARIAEFRQRLRLLPSRKDLSEKQKNREITEMKESLRVAEQDYQEVYEEIKQASPLWRNLITSSGQPNSLDTIQARLVPENGLMLLYQIGKEGSHLFIIPPAGQKPEAMPLQIPDNLTSVLEIEEGPLKSTALQKILVGQDAKDSARGLLQHLSSRKTDAAKLQSTLEKLQALRQVLVPASLWSRLVECKEVIIIPDGVLHLLPFEAMVGKADPDPKKTRYWLDEGPAIRYAPSATTLYNLEQRQVSSSATSTSALSLSDPIFDPKTVGQAMQQKSTTEPAASHDSTQAKPDSLSVFAATRGTFERASSALLRLEATARETEEIRKAFGRKSVVALMRLDANEPELRAELAGKRYLHLATHGVVEQQRSAMFAALALTPPPNETNVAENDGFLQLYEIYDLKLPDCELAVLSACKTNFGQYFEGEGVFALSRGFLAAGAARVIASHWDVDDKSTAELIGAFFRQIAADEKAGRKIHYAHALREAKRKVRNQDQWSAPYYWAPFVLTGKR